MTQYQTLKGFRDFVGFPARKRTWLTGIFREVFESAGFEPLETPALEYESLLLGKYGDEANKLIYSFEDRGKRRVALRYDQTVPTARVVAQYRSTLPTPYKRYQIQPVWRADNPQKGRFREFVQCDIDIIGAPAGLPDAQLLATASAVFDRLSVPVTLRVNDRAQLIASIRSAGVEESRVFSVIQTIDKLDKKSSSAVVEELRERGLTQDICDALFKTLRESRPSPSLQNIIDNAVALGVPGDRITFDSSLARGLDYYTGMICETMIPGYTAGSVGGGGRYDTLIGSLVGLDVPATGMAFGFDRLLEAVESLGKLPDDINQSVRVLVAVFSSDAVLYAASILKHLATHGISAELYSDPTKKIESQIKYAVARQIPYVVIVGPQEMEDRTVTVKRLDTRSQETVDLVKLIEIVQTV